MLRTSGLAGQPDEPLALLSGIASDALVRSSYRADEQRHAAQTGRGAVAY
jgi:hypothetical protein